MGDEEPQLGDRVVKCPKCPAHIYKPPQDNGGKCNHMKCSCGHEFCWLCRQDWGEINGYQHFGSETDYVCTTHGERYPVGMKWNVGDMVELRMSGVFYKARIYSPHDTTLPGEYSVGLDTRYESNHVFFRRNVDCPDCDGYGVDDDEVECAKCEGKAEVDIQSCQEERLRPLAFSDQPFAYCFGHCHLADNPDTAREAHPRYSLCHAAGDCRWIRGREGEGVYTGHWRQGPSGYKRHGQGKMEYRNGDTYEGQW